MSNLNIISCLRRSLLLCGIVLLTAHTLPAQETDKSAAAATTGAETVRIGATTFPVPKPWIGNRIAAPALPLKAFHQIPPEHTKDGSRLYVVRETYRALMKLLEAAKEDGIMLRIDSAYRSPGYQRKIIGRMMQQGRSYDDIIRYVAPPGYSEHALGTAVDFYPSNWAFARLPDYVWLHKNGPRFGFTETYPKDNDQHYPWEAWHWNFTKVDHEVHQALQEKTAPGTNDDGQSG